MTNAATAPGDLIISGIPQLPPNWWTDPPLSDPPIVWTVWDTHTYYLWGANPGNYNLSIGQPLNGGGMADTIIGSTRGRAHPHYVGVNTMGSSQMPLNDPVFQAVDALLVGGNNIVVPAFRDTPSTSGRKLALGTGYGAGQPGWGATQKYLLGKICELGNKASSVKIAPGCYWPDLQDPKQSPSTAKHYPIASLADVQNIVDKVLI